uniref:Uncharacterized protein n=1 Tax=Ailuropoda melanoleuca TaxID=9646 RepID=A0A7N5K2A0_AILME
LRRGTPAGKKRELAQQAVPSSSSWSPGVVVAAAFIVLSQNKGKCHRVVPGDFSVRSPPRRLGSFVSTPFSNPLHLVLSQE